MLRVTMLCHTDSLQILLKFIEKNCIRLLVFNTKENSINNLTLKSVLYILQSILSKTATSTVGKKNSTLAGNIPDKKRSNSEREVNTSSSKKKSTPVRFSATPEPKGRDRASSTPTASGVLFKEQEVDISAIGPPGYHLSHHSSGLESSLSGSIFSCTAQ